MDRIQSSSSTTIHVLIVSFPAQGQINPLLRLAKRLAFEAGFVVTFSTSSSAGQQIIKANGITSGQLYPVGDGFLRFEFFDVHIHGPKKFKEIYTELELQGPNTVLEMLRRVNNEGRLPRVSCIIQGNLVPWVSDVAEELGGVSLASYWAQSCASFLTVYYSFNRLVPFPTEKDPYRDVEIPTLPILKWDEIHSFLHPASPVPGMNMAWLREIQNMNKPFCVLMDTFDELEHDILVFTSKLCPSIKPAGPLLRAPNFISPDPFKVDTSCLDWLDSKPPRSVVYVSFGSVAHIKQEQVDEIAHGILTTGAPFLWVRSLVEPGSNLKAHTLLEEVRPDDGLVVDYSPQERVLAHPSVACFLMHCGWNSTMEALTLGVPMVAFPLKGDQLTDAKFLADVFGVAVRMGRGHHQDELVPREEVARCVREVTTGPKAEQMRRKATAWKDKAEKASEEGGSSHGNLQSFVDEIRRKSSSPLL